MAAVAIYSTDSEMRDWLRAQLRDASGVAVAGVVDAVPALARLVQATRVDAVLADALPQALHDWQEGHPGVPVIVLVGEVDADDALEALHAGAAAILPRLSGRSEIAAAIHGAINGLATLPRAVLDVLLDPSAPDAGAPPAMETASTTPPLTPREREVLAAMADGASNKVIARRLGISFHTAKFHVAAILTKLNADTRTEAVTKAAHLGLVML
jgi:DNA-binding NarL/FixJ family response regulator